MLKTTVRAIAPEPLLNTWRRVAFEVEQLRNRGRSLDRVFFDVYAKGKWGRPSTWSPFFSGVGSLPNTTAQYEAWVASLLERDRDAQVLVDIGCGDFQVGSRILKRLSRPVRYIGCDIASNVVAYNNSRFASPKIEFRQLDVTKDEAPLGDVVTVREVLQHLSNDAITKALKNLGKRFTTAIITECVPATMGQPNLDMDSGRWTRDHRESGVYVDLPPFNLPVLEECRTELPGKIYRTTLVSLRRV